MRICFDLSQMAMRSTIGIMAAFGWSSSATSFYCAFWVLYHPFGHSMSGFDFSCSWPGSRCSTVGNSSIG